MREIQDKLGDVYAVTDQVGTVQEKNTTKWYGSDQEGLQISRGSYNAGKVFDCHKHKERPREIPRTQETFVVIRGMLRIKIFDKHKELIGHAMLTGGDMIIIYKGYHRVEVMNDDTLFYESKTGPYVGVTEDKEYYSNDTSI